MDTIAGSKNPSRPPRYRRHSLEEKQQIVAETTQPGVSVASVARRHGMNDNMIFAWRKRLLEGDVRMLPVTVTQDSEEKNSERCAPNGIRHSFSADIRIEIRTASGHVIQIGAGAETPMVQAVLAALRA